MICWIKTDEAGRVVHKTECGRFEAWRTDSAVTGRRIWTLRDNQALGTDHWEHDARTLATAKAFAAEIAVRS